MNDIKLSKLLSLVLRHQPEAIGLDLDENGWADVDDLLPKLQKRDRTITLEQLERVVAENNKQRFRFSEDGLRIRANQGHSLEVKLGLSPVEPPEFLFHGTATRFLESILSEGLVRGTRQHVHLSADQKTAVIVGKRHGTPIVLRVMAAKMREEGLLFYCSENGVWLTDHVPVIYLEAL